MLTVMAAFAAMTARPLTFVSIKGERHHGTNWVRRMINAGCPATQFAVNSTADSDGAWGWKHGPFTFDTPPPNVLPLIMYRRVETWLPHMARNTYEATHRGPVSVAALLREPFPCTASVDALCPRGGEYSTAIHMLYAKYDAWANTPGIHLCYDTLARLGPAHLASALRAHGVMCSVFKMSLIGYASHTPRQKRLQNLTSAERAHALSRPQHGRCADH